MNATSVNQCDTWTFPSDLSVRRRLFCAEVFGHPAKLHLGFLQRLIDIYTRPGETLLDPMAGTGSLMIAATQMRNVILRDIQPEYIELIARSLPTIRFYGGLFTGLIDIDIADAKTFQCPPYDHIIMSPPYGFETGNGISNRRRAEIGTRLGKRWQRYIEAPNHASFAAGFRYAGGQSNAGNKSGRNYWNDMLPIYERCLMFLPSGGRMILILKNHFRRGRLIDIVEQTITVVERLGLPMIATHRRHIDRPSLWQRRRKEQGLPIVEDEIALVFGKGNSHVHDF